MDKSNNTHTEGKGLPLLSSLGDSKEGLNVGLSESVTPGARNSQEFKESASPLKPSRAGGCPVVANTGTAQYIYKGKYTPEYLESKIKEIADSLRRFPTSREIKKALSDTADKLINKIYPGGRAGLCTKLGYNTLRLRRDMRTKFNETGEKEIIDYLKQVAVFKERLHHKGLMPENVKAILDYLKDAELGLNIHRRKKPSYARIYTLGLVLHKLAALCEQEFDKPLTEITRYEAHELMEGLASGRILSLGGNRINPEPYHRDFTAFWHWWQRRNRWEGKEIPDISKDLSIPKRKNMFVYFTKAQLDKVLPFFNDDEQTLMLFCFDSIIRSPYELSNVLPRDLSIEDGETFVTIRQEISKTYERKFNLVLCGDKLKEFIERNKPEQDKPLFYKYAFSTTYREELQNKLRRVFIENFGDSVTAGGLPFSRLTLYAFRHSGACWFRGKAVPLDKLIFRGGWVGIERLNYYTKFLGMPGKITKEELKGGGL